MFLTDPVADAAGAAETALRRLGAVPTEPETSETPEPAPSQREPDRGPAPD
jgi:hypothetical protein